jgi:hypothetical protein
MTSKKTSLRKAKPKPLTLELKKVSGLKVQTRLRAGNQGRNFSAVKPGG